VCDRRVCELWSGYGPAITNPTNHHNVVLVELIECPHIEAACPRSPPGNADQHGHSLVLSRLQLRGLLMLPHNVYIAVHDTFVHHVDRQTLPASSGCQAGRVSAP
jgi:hypothetical protein